MGFFGGLIVYGFLMLLLILYFFEIGFVVCEMCMVVNYGFNKVCFIVLVLVGSWLCVVFKLLVVDDVFGGVK